MPGRYRRPTTPEQRAQADKARDDKLAGLHATLTEQVQALAAGPAWKRWLDVAARFHDYSFNNTLLLLAQKPDATHVAGYSLWQQLGRQVTKGEKGLAILAPVIRSAPTDDPKHTTPAASETQASVNGEQRRRVVGFRPAYVWDISQTTGDPLPEPPMPQLLAGQAPTGLWDSLAVHCQAAGFTVTRRPLDDGLNGYTDFAGRQVVVRTGVDDAQAVKTLAHEVGHVLLHAPADFAGERTALCRGEKEVEAESVAYLVAAAHGLDTAGYTFAYVAGWAHSTGDIDAALRTTAERVLTVARLLLEELAPENGELAGRVAAGEQRTAELLDRGRPAAVRPPAVGPRARLLAANAAAAAFFVERYPTSWAPGYLDSRLGWAQDGPPSGLGHAPSGWTQLADRLRAAGFTDEELLAAGLAARTAAGRLVDRFRDRLMFPIHAAGPDGAPQVIGFIGRRNPALDAADNPPPKYLNTPETPVFSKGRCLYRLAESAQLLAGGGLAVLVEGPVDALAVDLAGPGTMAGLAPLGTAFTRAHAAALAASLRPDLDRVVVATDADAAGRTAAAHAYDLLTAVGIDPRGAALPAGMDPALLAELHGPAALVGRVTTAEPLARQVASYSIAGRDLRWAETRVTAARAVADIVMRAPAETWQRELTAVATRTGLDLSTLQVRVVEQLVASPGRDGDALGRLIRRDRRDDLERRQHVPATAAQVAAQMAPGTSRQQGGTVRVASPPPPPTPSVAGPAAVQGTLSR
jgi:DNA primase catalytic core